MRMLLSSPLTGSNDGSKELMVLLARPIPTWFPTNVLYTKMDSTPLHSIPSACWCDLWCLNAMAYCTKEELALGSEVTFFCSILTRRFSLKLVSFYAPSSSSIAYVCLLVLSASHVTLCNLSARRLVHYASPNSTQLPCRRAEKLSMAK